MAESEGIKRIIRRLGCTAELRDFLARNERIDTRRFRYGALVDPTSACNLECVMCARPPAVRRVPEDDFLAGLARMLPHVDEIAFGARHEPLMHAGLHRMIGALDAERRARRLDAFLCVLTSGSLLDEAASRRLVDSGLDLLNLSVESAEPESYGLIRSPATWPDLRERIEGFQRIRRGSRLYVAVRSMFMRTSLPHMGHTIRALHGLGIHRVLFSQVIRVAPGVGEGEVVRMGGPAGAELRAAVEEAEATAAGLGVALELPVQAPDPRGAAPLPIFADGSWWDEDVLAEQRPTLCVAPWTKVRVDDQGRVFPCQLKSDPEEAWGSILSAPFEEIVNSDAARGHRFAFLRGDAPDRTCAACPYHAGATRGAGLPDPRPPAPPAGR